MFDDLLESTNEKKKTNKGWGFVLSGLVQALILSVLILIPLIYTEALPKAMLSTLLIAPPPPPPPPPPPAPVKTIVKPVARLIQSGKLMQPRAIPKEVAVFKEAELPPDVIPNAGPSGVFGGIPGGNMIAAAGPAAPPPPKPTAPARIKQGGNVTAASIITQTRPLYLRWRAKPAFRATLFFTRSSTRTGESRSSKWFPGTRSWSSRLSTP